MALPDGYLKDLRDNNDIVSVAQGYVDLKRSGSNYICRCPFHSDSTPSCTIYSPTQSFYCFGCGAGGDVITFVRLIENLSYIEAVKFLAQRAGMPMPEEKDDGSSEKRRRIYEINRTAGKFFHIQLFSPEGKAGYDYITGRGLTIHTIRHFGIGYAANDYQKLHTYMRGLGYSDNELVEASLIVFNNGRTYDKFRNRVMFPIFDARGNIIAFGGRALEKDAAAKYLNSGETFVFKKRENLFALNYAKNSKADYFILCEGYMDVIQMHQAGFNSAVATLGTAVTPTQARLIGRMGKKEVILSYDSDPPGQKAASRGIMLLSEAGVKARVLQMKGAKDPDEFIKKFGAPAFAHLIEDSGSAMDYELGKLEQGFDLNKNDDRSSYLKKAVVFLAQIKNPLDRAVYVSKIAKNAGIPVQTVNTAVEGEIYRQKNFAKKEEYRSLVAPRKEDSINPDSVRLPREEKAERGILCYSFYNQDKLDFINQKLSGGFVTAFNGRVFEFMKKSVENGGNLDFSAFNEEFSTGEMGRITGIMNGFSAFAHDNEALEDYIKILNDYNENKRQRDVGTMTDEQLREFAQRQKEKSK